MSRQDIAEVLASVRLLRGADAAFFNRVAQQPRARLVKRAEEMIFEAGDPADAVFVAFTQETGGPQGIVELSLPTGDAGRQSHLEHVVSGDVFGEFEFVASGLGGGRAVRRSSAWPVVDIDLYRIPFDLLAPLLAEADAVRARLIKLSFDRLMSALSVKSSQLLGDRDVAFANWLIKAAEDLGIAEGRHVRFSRTVSQREIAEALGVTRETMSLRLNEWERAGLLNTGGQSQRLEILDYPRVALRAAVDKEAAQEAVGAAIAEVDADLNRGDLIRARNIGLDMLTFFPSSPDLRHRVALANIRAGNIREALAGLAHGGFATGGDIPLLRERVGRGLLNPVAAPDRLFFDGGAPSAGAADDLEDALESEPDLKKRMPILVEDMAAIEARAQKELAFGATDAETRRSHAAASAEYYEGIYAAVRGTYAGINAAMMAGIAGERERAGKIAERIIRQIGSSREGYWANATLGEALLLTANESAAKDAFVAANLQPDASDGHRSSTRLQLGRIGTYLGIATEAHLAALPVGSTAVYSGPLFRGAELDDTAQRNLEDAIRGAVDAAIASQGVRYIYGALACGADIVIAEAALSAGVELHVVLPFPVDMFVETSVALGNPPDTPNRWNARFSQCLRRSASLTTLVERPTDTRQIDGYFFHAFKLAAGLALLRADTLSSHAVMFAVDDGQRPGSLAGTHTAAAGWSAADLPLVSIALRMNPRPAAKAAAQTDTFRPVIFLWPVGEPVDLQTMISEAGEACGVALGTLARSSRDRRSGVAAVVDTIDGALDVLRVLAGLAANVRESVRVIADFGPATDPKGAPSETAISRLSGASDLIGLPASIAIATLSFAARARAEPGHRVRFTPIGRTAGAASEKGGDGHGRPLPSREVYAVSFLGTPAKAAPTNKRRSR